MMHIEQVTMTLIPEKHLHILHSHYSTTSLANKHYHNTGNLAAPQFASAQATTT
jgi:hypothetical protein